MIAVKQQIVRKGTGFNAKEWRAKQQVAWGEAGKFWHSDILDKHFSSKYEREYQYKPRSKKYQLRKVKKMHHRNPLVWSGAALQAAKAIRDVRTKSTEAKIVLHLPKYFYAFHKPGTKDKKGRFYNTGQVNKARELMMISDADETMLAAELDKTLQEQIDKDPTRARPLGT
jgi:hypothetical protein